MSWIDIKIEVKASEILNEYLTNEIKFSSLYIS